MRRNLVVVGASAGGVDALMSLAASIPSAFPAVILVTLHVSPHAQSRLPEILGRVSPLKATHAVHGEVLEEGHIYIAPPDQHLLLQQNQARLTRGPRENGNRPAIDPLFRSAARWRGKQTIGVVLSGMLDDGTAGLVAIQRQGGVAVVQDPDDAAFDGMPRNAIEQLPVDHVVKVSEMGKLLEELVTEDLDAFSSPPVTEQPHELWPEDESSLDAPNLDVDKTAFQGPTSSFTCPDCHGTLWEIREGELVRYRCRVGHALSPDSLLSAQLDSVEAAMWAAYRALEEGAAIAKKLAERSMTKGLHRSAARYQEKQSEAIKRARVIREALTVVEKK